MTPERIDSIRKGLVIYPRLERIDEIKVDDIDFKPIVQNWIDAVHHAYETNVPPIPKDPPCGRCGYKSACKEVKEDEFLGHVKPIHLLIERIDRTIPFSDIISSEIISTLREIWTRAGLLDIFEESIGKDRVLSLLISGWISLGHELYINGVVKDLIQKKIHLALSSETPVGEELCNWNDSLVLQTLHRYVYVRNRFGSDTNISSALSYWDL